MTFQPGATLYTQSFGSRPENVEVPHYDVRAPRSSDVLYPIGKVWIWPNNAIYQLLGVTTSQGVTTATWVQLSDSSGSIQEIVGTSNQVTVSTASGTSTISLPSAITAPGSLTTTTSLASGTTVTAGTGITATTGDITATAGNIIAEINITSNNGNISALGGEISASGQITAGTTLTAGGDVTATNGNIIRGTAGNKDIYSSVASTTTAGANSAGTVTLVGGTATVATTAVTAASQIRLYRQGIGATGAAALGILTLGTKSAGVSFVINAVQAADATALQASDVSVIGWEIVN